MPELLTSNLVNFFKRFDHCYDGLLQNVIINYVGKKLIVTLSVQDRELDEDQNWVNLKLEIGDVTKFIIIEDKSTCVVLSSGLQVGFFNTFIYLDFCPYTQEPSGIDDFYKSHFLVVGKNCNWSVASYENNVIVSDQL